MIIGIYSRSIGKSSISVLNKIMTFLTERNVTVFLYKHVCDDDCLSLLEVEPNAWFDSHREVDAHWNMMISLGGDGTFLETVTYVRNKEIPILGVNIGRLGFLADIALNEIEQALAQVYQNKFTIEKRALIKLDASGFIDSSFNYGLNDFTIRKSDKATLIKIHTWINGEFLNTYWADGLIVSTPTGSTAYSLSVGGPIVVPESNNFIISPIASHNLTVRPLVVDSAHEIKMTVESRSTTHIASLDARSFYFERDLTFTLSRADFYINVVKIEGHSFFSTIRNKLMWGIDKRN
ncbi:MAG: NAD kinase [Salinivirgaceae bacterium]